MKSLKVFAVAAVLALTSVAPASAQFKWGPKIGFNTSKLHFDKGGLDTKNMTGFTGGLMAEFTVPVVGIAFDASVMYVDRGVNDQVTTLDANGNTTMVDNKHHSSYIEIPINLKYKFGLPVVGKIVSPFVFTGPSFAFLCSDKTWQDMKNKSCDVAWNFGLGVELLGHLQIAGSYGLGLNSSVERYWGVTGDQEIYEGKNRFWTVTAAYLF